MITNAFFDYNDIEFKMANLESEVNSNIISLYNKYDKLNLEINNNKINIETLQNIVNKQKQLLERYLNYIELPWYKRLFTKFKQ